MDEQTLPRTDSWRALCFLVWLSFQRHARAHLMVWIALGLLALTMVVVGMNTQAGRWTVAHWTYPRGKGPTYAQHVSNLGAFATILRGTTAAAPYQMAYETARAAVYETSGFFIFSNWIVFSLFTTFLLPLWSVSFASEGLGREREAQNLLWVLTRPISRPAIFFAKYFALLPWCFLLNLGGFALICLMGGSVGQRAFAVYWPAVFLATLAFSALFHMLGAWFRRASIVALLYAFFIETITGNMPGQFKRLSISFYTRCLMFDRAHEYGIHPDRPNIFLPVTGTTAWVVLAGVTVVCLIVGAVVFTRSEYLDVN